MTGRGMWRLISAGAVIAAVSLTACRRTPAPEAFIYRCDAFTLYPDSVVESGFVAKAEGFGAIESDYAFTDSSRCTPSVKLRFCLNGRDNEMEAASWHTAHIVPGDTTPVLIFGSTAADSIRFSSSEIAPSMRNRWTIRLDMRPVLRSLAAKGHYVTPTGDTIFRDHFKGVWVAGPHEPLTADVRTLRSRPDMQLLDHGDSTYLLTLNLRSFAPRRFDGGFVSVDSVPGSMPQLSSRQPLIDVCYSIASARLRQLLDSSDRLLAAGTSPTSHAVALSLALVDPWTSMELLRRRVRDGRIVQDGGAGGAWPISADRLMWIVAAKEVYNATGDRKWLKESLAVARRTLADDRHVLTQLRTGLLHGAPASPEWGPRTYPAWTSPRDLFQSVSLRVNTVYVAALKAYRSMCAAAGLDVPDMGVDEIADNVNLALWTPNLNRYSEFLYCGFYPLQSPATDNLGQALAIVAGVATPEMARALVRHTPRWHYGVAAGTPVASLAADRSMANTVQPHLLAWWALASAKASNCESVEGAVASFYRNFAFSLGGGCVDASSGRPPAGLRTAAADRMLADAATMAVSLRLFAGIRLDSAGMRFEPYIPPTFSNVHRIDRLRYRGATFDIEIRGRGNVVQSMTVDGHRIVNATLPPGMTGHHIVRIFMMNNRLGSQPVNIAAPDRLPPVPTVRWTAERQARISGYNADRVFMALENGVTADEMQRADFNVSDTHSFTAVNFAEMGGRRLTGFATRPHLVIPSRCVAILPASALGEAGTKLPVEARRENQFIELSPARNLNLTVALRSPRKADYFLDVRYANGSGQEDAQTRCVVRTLSVDGRRCGAIVMPCLGEGDWHAEAYSNVVPVTLHEGVNRIAITFTAPYDLNANRNRGTALIRHIRLIRRQ